MAMLLTAGKAHGDAPVCWKTPWRRPCVLGDPTAMPPLFAGRNHMEGCRLAKLQGQPSFQSGLPL